MKSIYKFPLAITDVQHILMPAGAEVLSVQTQRGEPFLWALVDVGLPQLVQRRTFYVYGTGNPVPDEESASRFIGTFQVLDGAFVGHVFEK